MQIRAKVTMCDQDLFSYTWNSPIGNKILCPEEGYEICEYIPAKQQLTIIILSFIPRLHKGQAIVAI